MIQIWQPKHPFGLPVEQFLFHRGAASCPPTYNATSKLNSDTRVSRVEATVSADYDRGGLLGRMGI
jgi:hypothetical protein